MKVETVAIVAAIMFALPSFAPAQEMPKMPPPQKEHEWLKQLVGEWDAEAKITMEPGKPPMTTTGTETVRDVGGFWSISEIKSSMMGMPFSGVQTLGYDPGKKKYIGTWVDSMNSYLWNYEGTLDAAGKVLTLETQGPCPMKAGQIVKFKEAIEIKSRDEKTFSSSMEGDDGKWTTNMTVNYRRKK